MTSAASTLASAVLIALVLAGCSSTPNARPQTLLKCDYKALKANAITGGPALTSMAYGSVRDIPADAVLISDAGLYNSVIVQQLGTQRTAGGTVQVSARLANCTGAAMSVRARTAFLDAGMAPAEPVSAWRTVFLPAGDMAVYQESSFSVDKAAHYYIELARNP
jgi:PBP1b-binding outer membrane lipoprotein LpoB